MSRTAIAIVAVALAAPASQAATFAATTATPSAARVVTRDIAWNCAGATCRGATEASRPVILCQGLAKRSGRIEQFAVDGRPLSAAELARCNAFAKGAAGPARARAN